MKGYQLIAPLLILAACKSAPPVEENTPAPPAELGPALAAGCQRECEAERQMQATAPEAIAAGCAADCQLRLEAPVAESVAALRSNLGLERRVLGQLEKTEAGLRLVFSDGAALVADPVRVEELEALVGQTVMLLASSELGSDGAELRLVRLGPFASAPGATRRR